MIQDVKKDTAIAVPFPTPFLAGGGREGEVPVATRLGGGLRPRDSSKSLSFLATCVHEALHSVRSTPSGDMRVWSSGDRVISSGTRDPGRALSLSLVCLLPIYGPSGTEQAGFSVREVFLVNNDEELEDEWSQLPEDLWDVVDDWPTEQKIQFVKIVTGSDRLPLPRTEMNKVELPFFAFSNRDHANLLRTLPKAHTCENLLEIPNYWESPLQARERAAGGVPEARGGGAFNEVSSHLNSIGMSSKFGGDTDASPVSEMKPAIRVSNDKIEFLSVYQHDEDDLLALSSPETADATLRGKPSPLGQNGEGPGVEGQKTVYDTSIDDLVDDLGIEGM